MSRTTLLVAFVLATFAAVCSIATADEPKRIHYPETRRVDHVDDYHGTKVADLYRWLEQDVRKSKEVADWVAAQNKVTFHYLESIPQRTAIRSRLTELWNYEKFVLDEHHRMQKLHLMLFLVSSSAFLGPAG